MHLLAGILAAGISVFALSSSLATAETIKGAQISEVSKVTDLSSRRRVYRSAYRYPRGGYGSFSAYRTVHRYPWNVPYPCGASVVFPRDPRCGYPGVGPWAYYYGLWGQ